MEKVKAFADWLTKWFTVIVIVWAVFNYFVPAASLWGKAYTGYMLGIVLFARDMAAAGKPLREAPITLEQARSLVLERGQ